MHALRGEANRRLGTARHGSSIGGGPSSCAWSPTCLRQAAGNQVGGGRPWRCGREVRAAGAAGPSLLGSNRVRCPISSRAAAGSVPSLPPIRARQTRWLRVPKGRSRDVVVRIERVVIGEDGRASLTRRARTWIVGARSVAVQSPPSRPIAGTRDTGYLHRPVVARGEEQGALAADVWAMACAFIAMATGAAPWSTSSSFVAACKIAYPDASRSLGARVAVNRGEGLHGGHVVPGKETWVIACHTRFMKETECILICAPGSVYTHTIDNKANIITKESIKDFIT